MRNDISKLLCERQRYGSKNKSKKTGMKLDPRLDYEEEDYEGGRAKSSRTEKVLNENLNPLLNFLQRSVGRPWDKVYSEIRENLNLNKSIDYHVIQHLFNYVELNVDMIGGVPYHRHGYVYQGILKVDQLYVNPNTGILCKPKITKRHQPKKADPPTRLHWKDMLYFKKEVHDLPAEPCGCVHFKLPDGTYTNPRYMYRDYTKLRELEICIHGNNRGTNEIWYVETMGYHQPDEIWNHEWISNPEYDSNIPEDFENPKRIRIPVYYRDRPEEMADPYVVSKKVANKKELKELRKLLKEN